MYEVIILNWLFCILIKYLILDSIFNDSMINEGLDLKSSVSFEEIEKEFKQTTSEYYDRLDLEHDQRDDWVKQFDFLIKSNKQADENTHISSTYLNTENFNEESSNQIQEKYMEQDYQNNRDKQSEVLYELSKVIQKDERWSLDGRKESLFI